ncbi:MAG: GntR family transcriptional regulator [Pseudomonadota bacterium]
MDKDLSLAEKPRSMRQRKPAKRHARPEPEEETLSERIARHIADEIISGKLLPGAHLNEQAIADQFSISRTPVREAIRQLIAADLVEMLPRRGAFVATIPVKRLIQMFEFISELEGICARLAARRMSQAEKDELKKLHNSYKTLVKSKDPTVYFEATLDFHRLIYAGAKNEPLEAATNQLYDRLTPYRRRQLTLGGRTEKSFNEHEEVLQAILDGDGDAAEKAMRNHTGVVVDNVMDMISSLGDD